MTSPTPVPAGLTGSLTVAIEGHPGVINPNSSVSITTPVRIPVKNVTKAVAVTGSASVRRTVVDVAKCNLCHEDLSLHGANRTPEAPSVALPFGSVAVCTMCHNTEATDISRRPAAGGIDGKSQETIDFKAMIHGIHSANIVIYGFGGSVNDFRDVTYPGFPANCQACHISPDPDDFPVTYTYSQPAVAAWGTTTDVGAGHGRQRGQPPHHQVGRDLPGLPLQLEPLQHEHGPGPREQERRSRHRQRRRLRPDAGADRRAEPVTATAWGILPPGS